MFTSSLLFTIVVLKLTLGSSSFVEQRRLPLRMKTSVCREFSSSLLPFTSPWVEKRRRSTS